MNSSEGDRISSSSDSNEGFGRLQTGQDTETNLNFASKISFNKSKANNYEILIDCVDASSNVSEF